MRFHQCHCDKEIEAEEGEIKPLVEYVAVTGSVRRTVADGRPVTSLCLLELDEVLVNKLKKHIQRKNNQE
jgi:hypothetical protein